MEDSLPQIARSTIHVLAGHQEDSFSPPSRRVRRAMTVLRRAAKSNHDRDRDLNDRIFRATGALRATERTHTAICTGRPLDVMFRLAIRVVRSVGAMRTPDC